MTGRVYIDQVDAYSAFGVVVLHGGYNGLLSWPSLKKVDANDWPEEDGIDVDLSSPHLDTREFSMLFGSVDSSKTIDLLHLLSDGAYHKFDFREIDCVKTLRLVSQPSKETLFNLEKFSLQLADDFPLEGYTYQPPIPVQTVWQTGHEIDEIDLSSYGVCLLSGTENEIMKSPAVKKNLLISNNAMKGAIYDGVNVFFEAKDVALKCVMRAPDLNTFWNNYHALLHNLSKPNERDFYIEKLEEEFPCYYSSSQVNHFTFHRGGLVWCDFSITLIFTQFRSGEIIYLLASEDDRFIITEDGHTIELKYG